MTPLDVAVVTNCHLRRNTGSSTVAIIGCGLARSHRIWIASPSDLSLRTGGLGTGSGFVRVDHVEPPFGIALGTEPVVRRHFSGFDAVLMRVQPPVDMEYVAACNILAATYAPSTLFVNDPGAIVLHPEKVFPLAYPDLHPPTIVTACLDDLLAFLAENKEVVVKPLYEYQGRKVQHLSLGDPEALHVLNEMTGSGATPVVLQKYIVGAESGDRRVFLIDGIPVGCLVRVPQPGSFVANLHAGATPVRAEITMRDCEIAERIAPDLVGAGLIFVALDIVGGYLIEIGTTSPTGLVQIREKCGVDIAGLLWDRIEASVGDQRHERHLLRPITR